MGGSVASVAGRELEAHCGRERGEGRAGASGPRSAPADGGESAAEILSASRRSLISR
jgi:hypothetical protein